MVKQDTIGKFAHIHFASNRDAANRLKKLGEENFRIKTVGAPQLDDIHKNLKEFNDIKKLLKGYGLDKIKIILYNFSSSS